MECTNICSLKVMKCRNICSLKNGTRFGGKYISVVHGHYLMLQSIEGIVLHGCLTLLLSSKALGTVSQIELKV